MREEIKAVSNKVGKFEKQLHESREDMGKMADKIEDVKGQQEVARDEAILQAQNTKQSLREVRT